MTRTAVVLGVALLVALDVVLAVLAWNHVYGDDVGGDLMEEIADPAADDGGSSATASDGGDGGTDTGSDSGAAAYDAAVVADELLARAPVRSCEAGPPARMEVSRDGGASFTTVKLPMSGLRRVEMASASEWVAVGSNRRCEPVARQTGDGGETWETVSLESAGWSLVGEGQVVSPAGSLGDIGCEPVSVSGVTEEDAVVLCDDGSLLRTENGGGFWGKQTTLPFASDVAFVSAAGGYALVERDGCAALVRETTDGGATWRDTQCISAGPPAAVAADGDVLVVITGDTVYRSGDRGDNWEVY